MYTGWIRGFKKNRFLSSDERASVLSREGAGVAPLQRLGLVSISSTFIEWIDRRFLYRGMLNMSVVFIVLIGFFAFSGFCFLKMAQGGAWRLGNWGDGYYVYGVCGFSICHFT